MIRGFVRLPSRERALLWRTGLLIAAIRAGLWLLPVRTLRRLLRGRIFGPLFPPELLSLCPDHLAWAVRTASRPVPAASCLTQALALQHLLAQSGRPSQIQIGVALDGDSGFRAHAWVEHDGRVLLDSPEQAACYVCLTSWKPL